MMMGWTRMMVMMMMIGMIEAKVNPFVQKSLLAGYRLWVYGAYFFSCCPWLGLEFRFLFF
jgi:hypothetical protein